MERYRLVHRGPGRMELYDELDDPREQKDVAADAPSRCARCGACWACCTPTRPLVEARWGTAANLNEAFYGPPGPPGRRGAEPKSGGPK